MADLKVDVGGRAALPGWVDSHTHLVFAGDRTAEFGARMAGAPYQAGGIAVTVAATRAATATPNRSRPPIRCRCSATPSASSGSARRDAG